MIKVDIWLNEVLLHYEVTLDAVFRTDGIDAYEEHRKTCGCCFEGYIEGYCKARWYIFTSQN